MNNKINFEKLGIDLYDHTKIAVEGIIESISSGNRKIIYTCGTGCGKSYTFMGVVRYYEMEKNGPMQILYVLPKHVIRNNVEAYEDFAKLDSNVVFVTYNAFTSVEKGMELFAGYDMVLIDECHHLGSDKYGSNLVECMNKSGCLVIGLTATSTRADGLNVEEYFDDVIEGIEVWDAIHMGLMPQFEYYVMNKDLREKLSDDEVAKITSSSSMNEVKEIVDSSNRNKWICYFSTEDELYNSLDDIYEIFDGYDVYVLLSSLSNLNEVMRGVRRSEKAVVLSINIMLEGVHLDGIHGIIIYRNVGSPVVFQQMIGRLCSIGNSTSPIVIDTSESAVRILLSLLEDFEESERNMSEGNTRGYKTRHIVTVGVSTITKLDIMDACERLLSKKREINIDKIKAFVEKYRKYKGHINYDSYDDLSKDTIGFKKFISCAKVCGINEYEKLFNALKRKYWEEL